jgi:hypothetical protein
MKFLVITLVALAIIAMIVVRFFRGRFPTASDMRAFTISLDVDKKPALFILMSNDGSINRMGRGTADDAERELFIGKIDPAIFTSICSHLTKRMLQSLGQGHEMQNPLGASCELTITFKLKDGTSNGIAFRYGSESEGPPNDVAEFVATAVAQTEPWYEEFRRNALRRKQG